MTNQTTREKLSRLKGLLFYTVAVIASLHSTTPVSAQFGEQAKDGITDVSGAPTDGNVEGIIQNIVNVLLFLVGAAAVVMIVIGGLRYILSNGDQQQAANARNTVLYSVIGLIVAVLAWAIVNYVLLEIYGTPADSSTTGPIAD